MVSPKLIECRKCGLVWERVYNAWVMNSMLHDEILARVSAGQSPTFERRMLLDAPVKFIEFDFVVPELKQ